MADLVCDLVKLAGQGLGHVKAWRVGGSNGGFGLMIGGDLDLGRARLCVALCWHSEAELGEAEASRCIRLRRVELLRLCTTEAVLRCTALRICAMAERLKGRHLEAYKRTPRSSDARGEALVGVLGENNPKPKPKIYKAKDEAFHDKHIHRKNFQVHDKVWLFNSRLRGKLKSRWDGPYIVVKACDNGLSQMKPNGVRLKTVNLALLGRQPKCTDFLIRSNRSCWKRVGAKSCKAAGVEAVQSCDGSSRVWRQGALEAAELSGADLGRHGAVAASRDQICWASEAGARRCCARGAHPALRRFLRLELRGATAEARSDGIWHTAGWRRSYLQADLKRISRPGVCKAGALVQRAGRGPRSAGCGVHAGQGDWCGRVRRALARSGCVLGV
ncbi:hypothetical protein Taro_024146 [Colocasia esculenta]|uniref:Uncharacterized protein n=1 Tax=Colocasia esculenta TaxID=4460 RepID=A0A843V620_COLES|nr:hypothetical protein [Colocasia esculenta]